MKIVLFLLLITYIFADASEATLDLSQGQTLTVGAEGTVKITVIANGDMTLKSLTNLALQKSDDATITITLTCTFESAFTFTTSDSSKEVQCKTAANPQTAGTYKLVNSDTIGGNDGTNDLSSVAFSIVNEPKTLSITQTNVDPCDGKAQAACTDTCTWNSATSKCVTAKVEVDPCDGKAQAACTDTCTWNSATSKCVTAEVEVDPCDGKAQAACTDTCTWNSATSKCVTAKVEEDPCDGKAQAACTGTCTWNSTTSKCVTAGSDTGGNSGSGTGNSGSGTGEGSESDNSGFLKLSVFICLFVLFL